MAYALITGASAGLGTEFARQLAAKGYDLLLVARRLGKLEQVADALRAERPQLQVRCLALDLTSPQAPQQLQEAAAGLEIAFLVNNAGAAGPALLEEQDWAIHRDYLQLMMTSVTELCHRFVPPMCERGRGFVVNVASVAGRISRAGDCHYGPSKAYLVALSEALAQTVKPRGVHVCALCPGFTHTDFHNEPGLAQMKAGTPAFIWYDPAVVVREGLRAVERGRAIEVSGRLYRWLDPWLQFTPTRALIRRFT